jgi:hypothetical protein
MKKFLTFALAAALCTPVFAQKTGMSNNNAPTVEQSVMAGGAKMSLNYISITWASGKTLESAMDKENGAGTRDYINGQATKKPLASFSTTVAVTSGYIKLDAGDYKVYYTISEACEWQINFAGKDDKVATMKLPLMDNGQPSKRLMMCLYAGDTEGAGVYIAFGEKMCMLDFKPAKAAK